MKGTIVVPLMMSKEQRAILDRTMQEQTACFNAVAREGFETGCCNGVELQKRTYSPLRQTFPDLPAQLVCAARVKACEAVKSALIWQKKHAARSHTMVEKARKQGKEPPAFKPVRCPQSRSAPICYNARSFWVKWESLTCSLATVAGRLEMTFTIPKHACQYLSGTVCSADLCLRHRRYFLHIMVSLPAPPIAASDEVVGVDLGLTRPAVSSTNQFLGERRWKEQEWRISRLRRHLQRHQERKETSQTALW